jgi:hypothetical protein
VVDLSGGTAAVTLRRVLPLAHYSIRAVTCASPDDAGFDGAVYVTLHGDSGSSRETRLVQLPAFVPSAAAVTGSVEVGVGAAANDVSGGGLFDKGASSVFDVRLEDVGALRYIDVRLDGTGSGSWWHPSRFQVTHTATGATHLLRCVVKMYSMSGCFCVATSADAAIYTA